MKSLYFIALFCFAFYGIQAQQAFSLDEAVQYALQNSNQIRLAQLDAIDAEAQIQEVRTAGIPKISGKIDYLYNAIILQQLVPAEFAGGNPGEFVALAFGVNNNLTGSVNLNTVLFDPTVFIGIKAARVYRELVKEQSGQTEFELKYNVKKAYLAALIAEKNKEILLDNISSVEKTLKETSAIYEEGFAEKLDVDRIQLSLQNLQTQVENVNQLIRLSYNVLKFQMGYPMDGEISLRDNIDLLVGNTLVDDTKLLDMDFDIANRPEYNVIKAGEALNVKNIEATKASNYPSLYGFATYQRSLQGNNFFDKEQRTWLEGAFAGLTLNVPIFNGFTTKYQIQQAEVDLQKTQLQLNDFNRAATLEYQNAMVSYSNAKRTVRFNQRNLDLAEKIYNTTQIKYREGVGSSLEVTQAENDLYMAQGSYVTSLYDLLVAKTDLEKALGMN
ncbi:MAG: TolC family protein [Bacteroidota bacterium]